jgi:hypothetical protein
MQDGGWLGERMSRPGRVLNRIPSTRKISAMKLPYFAAALLLTLMLLGCGAWEHASVHVVYGAESGPDEWRLDASNRKRVEDAFKSFSERNGYQCRAHVKRVEEIKCRGPKDLHLLFQPAMNKAEFVAEFTWVDSSDRTHQEFMRHVAQFKSDLAAAVGENNVRIADNI